MNTFGRKFRVSIFGESHGELIGVVLDGVPAGLELAEEDFVKDYLRHKRRGQRLIRRMRGGLRPEKHDDDTVDFLHHWADNAERY